MSENQLDCQGGVEQPRFAGKAVVAVQQFDYDEVDKRLRGDAEARDDFEREDDKLESLNEAMELIRPVFEFIFEVDPTLPAKRKAKLRATRMYAVVWALWPSMLEQDTLSDVAKQSFSLHRSMLSKYLVRFSKRFGVLTSSMAVGHRADIKDGKAHRGNLL